MWRTKDFDDVGFNLRRLRGTVPSGNLFETDEMGRVKQIARAPESKTPTPPLFWYPYPASLQIP